MADLAKLLQLRRLEEQLAEEQLMRARGVLRQIEALEQTLEQARHRADAALLEDMVAGHADGAIRHGQTTRQAVSSLAELSVRLTAQRAAVLALSEAHTLVYQERRRVDILLAASRQLHRTEEQRRDQRRLDDSYLVVRTRLPAWTRRKRRTDEAAE